MGHQRACSPTWVLYYCGAAARAGGMGEGSHGFLWWPSLPPWWEAHPLCCSPGMLQPCNSAFIAVTPLPHLLPSILGCSFIRTALQLSLLSFPLFKGRTKRLEIFTVSGNRLSPRGDSIISTVSYSEINKLLCIYFRRCPYGLLNQHALRSLSASPTAQILFLQFSVSCRN